MKSDWYIYALDVFHSFGMCPISLLQICHVKVNLLHDESQSKRSAAASSHEGVQGMSGQARSGGLGRGGDWVCVDQREDRLMGEHSPMGGGGVGELCSASSAFSREM